MPPRSLRNQIVYMLLFIFFLALSAHSKPARVVFTGIWDRSVPLLSEASHETQFSISILKPAELLKALEKTNEQPFQIIFLLNLESADALALKNSLLSHPAADRRVIPLDKRSAHGELDKAGLLTADTNIVKY